jgi:hypothetical protein
MLWEDEFYESGQTIVARIDFIPNSSGLLQPSDEQVTNLPQTRDKIKRRRAFALRRSS